MDVDPLIGTIWILHSIELSSKKYNGHRYEVLDKGPYGYRGKSLDRVSGNNCHMDIENSNHWSRWEPLKKVKSRISYLIPKD